MTIPQLVSVERFNLLDDALCVGTHCPGGVFLFLTLVPLVQHIWLKSSVWCRPVVKTNLRGVLIYTDSAEVVSSCGENPVNLSTEDFPYEHTEWLLQA